MILPHHQAKPEQSRCITDCPSLMHSKLVEKQQGFIHTWAPCPRGPPTGGNIQVRALQTKRCRTYIQHRFFSFPVAHNYPVTSMIFYFLGLKSRQQIFCSWRIPESLEEPSEVCLITDGFPYGERNYVVLGPQQLNFTHLY